MSAPGGPTAGPAEVVQRILCHEEQDMGVLLGSDLEDQHVPFTAE